MVWTGGFTFRCVFCNSEFGYKNYDFKDFHIVNVHCGLVLAVSDQDQAGLNFLQDSLSCFTTAAGGYPEHICCSLCGETIILDRECGGDYRLDTMTSHLTEIHLVLSKAQMFAEFSLLSSARLSSLIDALLLKNPFRLGRYNKFKTKINAVSKQEEEEKDEKKRDGLVSKLEFMLTDNSGENRRRYKVRSDKGVKKGKMKNTLWKPKESYQCEACPYKTEGKHYIIRHIRIHTGEKPYQCNSCDQAFRTTSGISGHKKRIHVKERNQVCTDCGKSFISSGDLKIHSITHLEVKPNTFKCNICDYACSINGRLNKHKRQHFPPTKTYKCDQCDKEFRNTSHLKRHIKLHADTGEKPFHCVLCDTSFRENYNLKQHVILVHKQVKRVECLKCNEKYSKKHDLKHHIETKHKDEKEEKIFSCYECCKTYPHERALKNHKYLFHKVTRRHPCDPCRKSFKTLTKLKRHYTTELHRSKFLHI